MCFSVVGRPISGSLMAFWCEKRVARTCVVVYVAAFYVVVVCMYVCVSVVRVRGACVCACVYVMATWTCCVMFVWCL